MGSRDDWFGPGFFTGWKAWGGPFGPGGPRGPRGGGRGRRRQQMFESGEVKFVILKLLKEKPMHGYEVMRALEERMAGCYTPSAGTVYPTLQMLEDEGYVRAQEADGKKVYHITPEGEKYLEQNRDLLDEIIARVRETVREFTGGGMAEVQGAFARLASVTFKNAMRRGPDDPGLARVAEILKKAAEDVEEVWRPKSTTG